MTVFRVAKPWEFCDPALWLCGRIGSEWCGKESVGKSFLTHQRTSVLLRIVMVEASVGGEESCTFHPWSTWDVLGEHVEVVAHAVRGVCCSSGVPLDDMEECVASPKVFA
jgi:hypothetical protein